MRTKQKGLTPQSQLSFDFSPPVQTFFKLCSLENIIETLPKLFPEQQKDVLLAENRFEHSKGILFTNGTGTGKAQPLSSKILTPTGWTTMGKLKVNDFVIDSEGLPTKVNAIYPQGKLKIYKVILSDGSSTECCQEHLWETQTLQERRNTTKQKEGRKTKYPNKWKPKVRSLKSIKNSIDKRHFIPIVKPIKFSEAKLPVDPYTLGALLGDGSLTTKSISISTKDIEIIRKIENNLPLEIKLVKITHPKKCPQFRFTQKTILKDKNGWMLPNPFNQKIKELDLYGKKSNNKFIPSQYLFSSIKQREQLLQGLMDTDGYIDKRSKSIYYTSVSKELIEGVESLVNSLGGVCSKTSKIPTYLYNGKKQTGQLAFTLCINLPKQFKPFYIKRKLNFYRPNYKYYPKRVITKVEFAGYAKCQCISIESKRKLYVTDDYILTHNTFTGLGIIKRFKLQNKNNVLIVVPTDKKAKDWMLEANMLELSIRQLENINCAYEGITVTTYSNFYQNEAIVNQFYDLIVYDESHYLLQNEAGNATQALNKHKKIAKLPSSVIGIERENYLREIAKVKKLDFKKLYADEITKLTGNTKVVFLSASPFAYHKSLLIGDGTLWNIYESYEYKEGQYGGYNSGDSYDSFFQSHFGYKMRYNKLTRPGSEVDMNLMERNFYEKFKEKGVISGRSIQVDKDYSRDFIVLNSEIGNYIDQMKSLFYSKEFSDAYPTLSQFANRKFNFNYTNQLLECIKAKEVLPRIKQHLELGRKVILFHNYNNSLPEHPFRFKASSLLKKDEEKHYYSLQQDIAQFEEDHSDAVNLDLSNLINPRDTIKNAFQEVREFNGTVSKRKRSNYLDEFNKSNEVNIMLVQTKAGKEGISMHDKVGDTPRVLINLGLPTAPTDAIQIEGRIYRIGLMSNAMYEYVTLQTNFERQAFAEKIATRSRTAENLALGNQARNMETVFREGYQNASSFEPNLTQGTGGKLSDYTFNEISEFEKSKTYYYSNASKTNRNKSAEGVDYYATPEPLGYKMAEWLNLKPGNHVLEPSAGHGAIARFFPTNTENVFVEPSYTLSSKLALNTKGDIKQCTFENYSIWNKFEGIAMNPPFGKSGKTAMEHIEKATKHLRYNGTIISIVPAGPSMEKRLNQFFDSPETRDLYLTKIWSLPQCLFERAGTKVYCNLIFIEKSETEKQTTYKNLSHFSTINDFFDEIEHISV